MVIAMLMRDTPDIISPQDDGHSRQVALLIMRGLAKARTHHKMPCAQAAGHRLATPRIEAAQSFHAFNAQEERSYQFHEARRSVAKTLPRDDDDEKDSSILGFA